MARILVIDDVPEIVELYRDILSEEGYDVVTSLQPLANPHEVELVEPDLIILDWMFGNIAVGIETITMLTENPPIASIPVIVCTAATKTVQDVEPMLRELGIPIIYKPFNVDELLATVEQTLAASASRQRVAASPELL